ncbi:MAG: hypothetical protein CMN32_06505 [Saprospirales bacterium]|nr:hypothetical protein [Saprospirales bacterium]
MEMMNKILMSVLLLFFSGFLAAQPLEQLLAQADSNNLELKALYQDYLAALEKAPQVSQLPEPEAGLGVFALPVETRLGPQWVRLSATQQFPWKGTLDARRDLMLVMAKAQFEKIAATRLNLHYKVKAAYYQLYELAKKQLIIRRSIDVFRRMESIALANVEAGRSKLADVLRIQIRIKDLEEELELLETQKQKPLAVINGLLNRNAGAPVVPVDTLTTIDPAYSLDSIQALIAAGHPVLRMFSLQQEASREAIKLNELEGKPSFAAGLDYIFVGERSDANPDGNGRDILSPRIGVRIPLYREKYDAKEQEERIKIHALELRKEDLQLQFRTALEQAFANWDDARIRFQLFEDQKQTTLSVLDLLMAAYSAEGASFIDLLQTEDQYIKYDLMQLSAVVKMYQAQAEIERYIP